MQFNAILNAIQCGHVFCTSDLLGINAVENKKFSSGRVELGGEVRDSRSGSNSSSAFRYLLTAIDPNGHAGS
jgi:hypothetical protein